MVADDSTPEIPTKTCTKCGETKPETDFWLHHRRTAASQHAHRSTPDRRRSRWKVCEKAAHDAYVEANREDLNASCRTIRHGNDRHLTKKRDWTDKNREKVNRQWRQRDPLRRAEHPEKARAKRKNGNAQRRARMVNAPQNDWSVQQWQDILQACEHRCASCGKRNKRLTMDHIVPLALSGSHTVSNGVPACLACNRKKDIGPPLLPIQPLLLTLAKPLRKIKSKS